MNEDRSRFAAPGDPERVNPEGVRTYRGRTIEELIPIIRAELGPDAIILREREGLTGGIGGFFAQRCVEIDAQAAPRLSVYDDDFDDDDGFEDDHDEYTEETDALVEEPPPPIAQEPALPVFPEPAPVPAAPLLDEASFAARLEEATFAAEPPPQTVSERGSESRRSAAPMFIAFDELGDQEPEAEPEGEPEPEAEATAEPSPPVVPYRLLDLAEIDYAEPTPEAADEPALELENLKPDPAAPWMTFAAEQVAAPAVEPVVRARPAPAPAASAAPPPLAAPAPPPAARPAPAGEPSPAVAQSPPSAPAPQSAPVSPPEVAQYAGPAPATGYQSWPSSVYPRRRSGILPAAERMLRAALEATAGANERRNLELQARAALQARALSAPTGSAQPAVPAPVVPPQSREPESTQPDPDADDRARQREEEHRREAQLQERLAQSGISSRRAAALVAAAISRRGPFSEESDLAHEVRSAIVSALSAPRPVPRRGAIAVVGAGGSGKTRCVAALAAAYAGAGIPVSAASFGAAAREDELGELLHGENVNVIPAMRTRATARAVASAREEALVIIDTVSATPGDGSTIDVIAEAVRSFELDAIYLAVPATLSLPAALKLVDGFSAFDLTGLIATHVDETDELGVIAELAMQTGIAVAYTHTGLDLQHAIASADAEDIATSVLSS